MNEQKPPSAIEWRDIPGYESIYQVSNTGLVKRLAGSPKCRKDRVLKPSKNKGYFYVSLCVGGIDWKRGVHQLVAWAFIGEQGDLDVNHKDGKPANNNLENLEYTTRSGNMQHAVQTGLRQYPIGGKHWTAKLTDAEVFQIRMAFNLCGDQLNRKEVAKQFGIGTTALTNIINYNSYKNVEV